MPISLSPALKSRWLVMHVSAMLFSYGILIAGSLLSGVFVILKNKKVRRSQPVLNTSVNPYFIKFVKTSFYYNKKLMHSAPVVTPKFTNIHQSIRFKLSLLKTIDYLSYQLISCGFILLTIGIIAGAIWANEAWGSYWSWDPKETWALTTWIVFASYLHNRLINKWENEKSALIASWGFLVIWICYLGINLFGKGLHVYGQVIN